MANAIANNLCNDGVSQETVWMVHLKLTQWLPPSLTTTSHAIAPCHRPGSPTQMSLASAAWAQAGMDSCETLAGFGCHGWHVLSESISLPFFLSHQRCPKFQPQMSNEARFMLQDPALVQSQNLNIRYNDVNSCIYWWIIRNKIR